jgi:hypothetical protein
MAAALENLRSGEKVLRHRHWSADHSSRTIKLQWAKDPSDVKAQND